MNKFRLHRRAVLKGAGSIAIGLPWLEIMGHGRKAHAQTTTFPAKRFVTVYQPGGTVRNKYTPLSGSSDTALVLSPILSPLEPVKSKLLVVDGLDMKSAVGEQHQAGIIAWLTGSVQAANGTQYAKDSPSIDQVLAPRLSMGKRIASIQMAIRWATGKSHGLVSPINAANFDTTPPASGSSTGYQPIAPRLDPQQIFTDLFGNLMPPGMTDPNALALMKKKSVLDFVNKKYTALSMRLGAADKVKLDQHLTKIREMEMSISIPPPVVSAVCKQPTRVDTSNYNPKSGLNSANDGSIKDTSTDAEIPKVGKFMTDMLVMALACDLTGVVSFQWSDTEAKHTFPWLSLSEHHHYYQHDGGFRAAECEKVCNWYSQQHLYLLQEMQKVDMGGHTLLDESVVFFGTEIQDPPTHTKNNMPFLLAGNGGGLRTGRWLRATSGTSHNALLVALLNLFGDTRTSFGTAAHAAPALAGLK
jgi:hypothetical protein